MTKQDTLQHIVTLVKDDNISRGELLQALKAAEVYQSSTSFITKLFGYLGAIFVFSGIAVYANMFWGEMNSAARIIITLGSGVACYTVGILALKDRHYYGIASYLLLVSAIVQPLGLFVTLDELFDGGDWHIASMLVCGVMFLQQALTFISKRLELFVHTMLIFGSAFFVTVFDYLELDKEVMGMCVGLSLMFISWYLDKTEYKVITPIWYLVGSASFLSAVFEILEDTPVEVLFMGISGLVIYLSTLAKSRILLWTGAISMISYVFYFTREYFLNSVGWPITLVIFGIVLLGASRATMKIGDKYVKV